tara:strand:- start:536 stop:856 length:321 start_codon:yes stop_codon:yes gene_type:complete
MTVLHSNQVTELAEIFGLLADPTRLAIVIACIHEKKSAGEIARNLDISPSLASHHLRLLRATRMLGAKRRGKQVFYDMSDDCVRDILNTMINHLFVHGDRDNEEII